MKRGWNRIGLGTFLGMGEGGRLYTVYRNLERERPDGMGLSLQFDIVRTAGDGITGTDFDYHGGKTSHTRTGCIACICICASLLPLHHSNHALVTTPANTAFKEGTQLSKKNHKFFF